MLEGLYFFTGKEIYLRISAFWTKIFSIAFGMGVVSGIIMPFQFGTNWSRFSDATANVISPLLAYEGLMAFFLEATFLGVLLFGRSLVPRWAHFFAAVMVAFGTLLSSFWILATNSWMQTPAGYEIVDGRFFPKSWMEIIFNPSFPYRLAHTVVGFYVTTGFVVVGGRGLPDPQRTLVRRRPGHAVHDPVAAAGAGAAADLSRRRCTVSTRLSISRRSWPPSKRAGRPRSGRAADLVRASPISRPRPTASPSTCRGSAA